MQIEYAKELLAVDCERILDTVGVLDLESGQLTHDQKQAKDRLHAAAEEAIVAFKHPAEVTA